MLFGNIILFGWPVIAAIIFAKFDVPKAISVSLIFGYLFLPEQINFNPPVLPTLEKHTIPALVTLIFVLLWDNKSSHAALPGWIPKGTLPRSLLLLLVTSSFLTVISNADELFYGSVYLPALRPYDGFSIILSLLVGLIPFFLARKFLAHPEQQKMLLIIFVTGGFIYSFLALFEVRMSPQLNVMVYGFFPHSFLQHIRGDGFRPLVFLNHGLWLAIFFAATILAAFSLSRALEVDLRRKYLGLGFWILLTLSLSNSLGAFVIVLCLIPVALLAGPRLQLIFCAVMALIILFYPAVRGAGLLPLDAILDWARGVSADRADSLAFRLHNEDLLLAKAQERSFFGWGGFGRNMVFDEFGRELTVTDGYWIIIVGQGGWVRYLAEFGLLCLPAVIAAVTARKNFFGFETTGLLLMLIANLVDMLPNGTMTPLTWVLVGAVWGRIELGHLSTVTQSKITNPSARPKVRYTRFNGPEFSISKSRDDTNTAGAARKHPT